MPLPFPDPPGPRSPPHVPVSPDTPSSSRTLTPSRGRYGLPRSLAVSRGDAGPTSRFPQATPGSFPCRVFKLDELSSAATFAFLPPSFRLHRRRVPGYAPSSLRGPGLRDAAALPDAAPSRRSRSCAPVPPSALTPPTWFPPAALRSLASSRPLLPSFAPQQSVHTSLPQLRLQRLPFHPPAEPPGTRTDRRGTPWQDRILPTAPRPQGPAPAGSLPAGNLRHAVAPCGPLAAFGDGRIPRRLLCPADARVLTRSVILRLPAAPRPTPSDSLH